MLYRTELHLDVHEYFLKLIDRSLQIQQKLDIISTRTHFFIVPPPAMALWNLILLDLRLISVILSTNPTTANSTSEKKMKATHTKNQRSMA